MQADHLASNAAHVSLVKNVQHGSKSVGESSDTRGQEFKSTSGDTLVHVRTPSIQSGVDSSIQYA